MSYQFHTLKINSFHRETDDSVIIGFEIPASVRDQYQWRGGQNITIRFFKGGEEYRRTYSICTIPEEGALKIGVRAVPDGIFSDMALHHLQSGDLLDIMVPTGNFTVENKQPVSGMYVFFAVGSGITPVISMIKEILSHDQEAEVILFYGNKSISSIMFRDELDDLKNNYLSRIQVVHILTREHLDNELFYGRLTPEKCAELTRLFVRDAGKCQYFICGPEILTFSIKDLLVNQLQIPASSVHFELFHTGNVAEHHVTEQAPVSGKAMVTVRLDGKDTVIEMSFKGKSILEAGISKGLDLPYSCQGGVCSTCKAHLVKGKVHMDVNYALEEDELQAGYILTCQSHPRSNDLTVNYDY